MGFFTLKTSDQIAGEKLLNAEANARKLSYQEAGLDSCVQCFQDALLRQIAQSKYMAENINKMFTTHGLKPYTNYPFPSVSSLEYRYTKYTLLILWGNLADEPSDSVVQLNVEWNYAADLWTMYWFTKTETQELRTFDQDLTLQDMVKKGPPAWWKTELLDMKPYDPRSNSRG